MPTEQNDINIIIKNKHFRWLGMLLIGIGVLLILNTLTGLNVSLMQIKDNFYIGLIGIIFGGIMLFVSRKQKEIRLTSDKIEYLDATKKRILFSAKYNEINMLRTFKDANNHSRNLMIYIDEGKVISFSSSYISEEELQMLWKKLLSQCKIYIDNSELTIENELNW